MKTEELKEAIKELQELTLQLTAMVQELADEGADSCRNPEKRAFLSNAIGDAQLSVQVRQSELVGQPSRGPEN